MGLFWFYKNYQQKVRNYTFFVDNLVKNVDKLGYYNGCKNFVIYKTIEMTGF